MTVTAIITEMNPTYNVLAKAKVTFSMLDMTVYDIQLIKNKVNHDFKVVFPARAGMKTSSISINNPELLEKITDAVAAMYLKRIRKDSRQNVITSINDLHMGEHDRKYGKEVHRKLIRSFKN